MSVVAPPAAPTVALTGASGYLGRAVRRLLAEERARVITIGRRDADIVVDLSASAAPWGARSPEVLVHAANPMTADAQAVLDSARIAANTLAGLPGSVKHLVLVSSAYVYPLSRTPLDEDAAPAPVDAYGHAKLAVEELFRGFAKASGHGLTVLRPCAIFGPGDPHRKAVSIFAAAARAGKALTLSGPFRQPRDYIHIADAARAVALAISQRPAGIFNVCTGHSWSAAAICDLIGSVKPELRIPIEGPLADEVGYKFDPTRAREALGFSAAITMTQALEQLILEPS